MNPVAGPDEVIWDITSACPLRCVHCYSESGRRPSRQQSTDDMLRVADAIVSLRPQGDWAAAVRHLDQHIGTADDRERIANRPAYRAPTFDQAVLLPVLAGSVAIDGDGR